MNTSFPATRRLRECTAPGCTAVIHAALFLCQRHWALVPIAVRDRVLDTWDRYYRGCASAAEVDAAERAARASIATAPAPGSERGAA